jgi:hypothetical protein
VLGARSRDVLWRRSHLVRGYEVLLFLPVCGEGRVKGGSEKASTGTATGTYVSMYGWMSVCMYLCAYGRNFHFGRGGL